MVILVRGLCWSGIVGGGGCWCTCFKRSFVLMEFFYGCVLCNKLNVWF